MTYLIFQGNHTKLTFRGQISSYTSEKLQYFQHFFITYHHFKNDFLLCFKNSLSLFSIPCIFCRGVFSLLKSSYFVQTHRPQWRTHRWQKILTTILVHTVDCVAETTNTEKHEILTACQRKSKNQVVIKFRHTLQHTDQVVRKSGL